MIDLNDESKILMACSEIEVEAHRIRRRIKAGMADSRVADSLALIRNRVERIASAEKCRQYRLAIADQD